MAMSTQDNQFVEEMVQQLDETIRELAKREEELLIVLGPDRVEEMKELWNRSLNRQDELELRRSMDWRDSELLWVWSRQRRTHSTRANAGKTLMRVHSGDTFTS